MPVMTGLSDQARVPNEFCHKRVGGRSCLCYNYSLSSAFSHSLCTVHVGALYHLSTLCLLPIPLPYSMSLSFPYRPHAYSILSLLSHLSVALPLFQMPYSMSISLSYIFGLNAKTTAFV